MKVSGFWVLFVAVGTALMVLKLTNSFIISSVPDMVFTHHSDGTRMTATSRKLKEDVHCPNTDEGNDASNVNPDDYQPIDPVPSSKASVRPGPIQHGTPLMPYIPKPSPPGHPNVGDSP